MLTAQDRCQAKACGAQAWWSTWIDYSELTWCHHHFREYEVKLREAAMAVMDHREPEDRW